MSNTPKAREEVVRAFYEYADQLLRSGKSKLEVQQALVEKGLKLEIAAAITDRQSQSNLKKQTLRPLRWQLIRNFLYIIAGLVALSIAATDTVYYAKLGFGILFLLRGTVGIGWYLWRYVTI